MRVSRARFLDIGWGGTVFDMKIYDLSVPLLNGMHYWPGDPAPELKRMQDHERGDAWTASHWSSSLHIGTHVDAPLHRIRGGKAIDAVDPDTFIGRAYVADLTDVAKAITAHNLEGADIPVGVQRVLLKTRNAALWKREGFQKDYVGLSADGAQWIVQHKIRLVGMDYLGADIFLTDAAPAHDVLLGNGVIIVEGLMLEHVAAGWYTLICLPIKLQDADGAPARAILIDDQDVTTKGIGFFEEEK